MCVDSLFAANSCITRVVDLVYDAVAKILCTDHGWRKKYGNGFIVGVYLLYNVHANHVIFETH